MKTEKKSFIEILNLLSLPKLHFFQLYKSNGRCYNIKSGSKSVVYNATATPQTEQIVGSENSDEDEALAVTLIESTADAAALSGFKVQVLIEIGDTSEQVPFVQELCPNDVKNAIRFTFTTRKSGMYNISVIVNSHKMSFQHGFVPGELAYIS